MEHISTVLQPADPGTKPSSAPVLFRAMDYAIGTRFYPPTDSEHAAHMELSLYNAAHTFTMPDHVSDDSLTIESPTSLNNDLSTSIVESSMSGIKSPAKVPTDVQDDSPPSAIKSQHDSHLSATDSPTTVPTPVQ